MLMVISEEKLNDEQTRSSETELLKNIKLTPTYVNLSDYCYYGSANAMLKAEIDDIIYKYPFSSEEGEEEKDKEDFFNISNPTTLPSLPSYLTFSPIFGRRCLYSSYKSFS